ncbi:acyltransferase domain-containing protein [Dactylosporangium sp. CA-233914]|uniref:acyltransferase domain-containing protein n=1 Tax=Dactylosporangium sp. CA-233914 TaxID=3239934 RepID=UPI003D8F2F32
MAAELALMDTTVVRGTLGLDDTFGPWLQALEAVGPAGRFDVPDDAELVAMLARLDVSAREHPEIAAALQRLHAPGPYRWLLQRQAGRLIASMGDPAPFDPGPSLPGAGPQDRWFHLAAFLACYPAILGYHSELGIAAQVSQASLADLGNKTAVHRRIHGSGGMAKQYMVQMSFRGILYRLGRLQYTIVLPAAGSAGLEIHIPEDGPLAPQAVDDSLQHATRFFARHFPGVAEGGLRLVCKSWLLDAQLAEYLPADSNILRFQRRFTVDDADDADDAGLRDGAQLSEADRDITEFVFRKQITCHAQAEALPARTTLERAVVAHLMSGRHWREPHGLLTPPAARG